MNIKLVVGLGNPEIKYSSTRHNIGYRVIDNLLKQYGCWSPIFREEQKGKLYVGYKVLCLLLKSTTGMNDSGICVAKVIKDLDLMPSNILVVYDDIYIPFNTFKLREKGGDGGHNGIKSIINELGTNEFPRLRIGIGKPQNQSILDHVLSDFNETEDVDKLITNSCYVITNVLKGLIKQADTFIFD